MNLLSWVLIGGALAAAGAAIDAGSNLVVAVPAGAAAVLLVTVVGVTEIQSRASPLSPTEGEKASAPIRERVTGDSLLQLRRAFQSGKIGRSLILATVHALERDLGPGGPMPLSLDEERKTLDLPPEEFRKWIDDRLHHIEAAS